MEAGWSLVVLEPAACLGGSDSFPVGGGVRLHQVRSPKDFPLADLLLPGGLPASSVVLHSPLLTTNKLLPQHAIFDNIVKCFIYSTCCLEVSVGGMDGPGLFNYLTFPPQFKALTDKRNVKYIYSYRANLSVAN